MSLQPQSSHPIPDETQRVARAAFPNGNVYIRMRDELGDLYTDELFAELFPLGCESVWAGPLDPIGFASDAAEPLWKNHQYLIDRREDLHTFRWLVPCHEACRGRLLRLLATRNKTFRAFVTT